MANNVCIVKTGGVKELILLFFPISLMTFSSCLFLFVEKLLLGRLSSEAMEVAVNAAYAVQIFQSPCVALVMMAQVFVGRWRGSGEWELIGPGIWQFIWFSFFSMFITVPGSLTYAHFYFGGTDIEDLIFPYYYFLTAISFLFPLSATLSCFYLGQGKTKLVLWATIFAQLFKLLLAYLFIFGWNGWFPSLGLLGGIASTVIVQGGYCLLLLAIFLNSKHAKMFQSRTWFFKPSLFWECINPGSLRAINRVLSFLSWAAIAHMMIAKGGDYLLILSIGGTLFVFLPFLGDAICQAQTTVISHIVGAKNYEAMKTAFRSGCLLVIYSCAILSIPLVFFPIDTFHYLFPKVTTLTDPSIFKVSLGIWISFLFYTFVFVPISYVLAFKDTGFSFFMGIFSWINGYLFMYLAIEKFNIAADQFWLVLTLYHGSTALMYYLRMKWLRAKVSSQNQIAELPSGAR